MTRKRAHDTPKLKSAEGSQRFGDIEPGGCRQVVKRGRPIGQLLPKSASWFFARVARRVTQIEQRPLPPAGRTASRFPYLPQHIGGRLDNSSAGTEKIVYAARHSLVDGAGDSEDFPAKLQR